MNPYYDTDFFTFFWVFVQRLFALATGQLAVSALVSDEVQIFVLAAIGVSASLVGTFLILRKMTMLANSLSHTILLGIVVAFYFTSSVEALHEGVMPIVPLLTASFAVGLLTAFLTELLTKWAKLQEDASTGLVFTTFFALGIIFVNLLTRNAHIGAEVVMGNVDALQSGDLKLALILLAIDLAAIILFYKEWQITTFDPGLAKVFGISPHFFNYALMALVSFTVVAAFRAIGVLMVLTYITAPPLTARLFSGSLKGVLLIGSLLSIAISIIGVALSRHLLSVNGLALSTGGITVTLMGIVYLTALLLKTSGSKKYA